MLDRDGDVVEEIPEVVEKSKDRLKDKIRGANSCT